MWNPYNKVVQDHRDGYPTVQIEDLRATQLQYWNPVMWNPYNKVVQDHRDGTIHHERTNAERQLRGLPTPWNPEKVSGKMFTY